MTSYCLDIKSYLEERRIQVESTLAQLLPAEAGELSSHIESLRYSLFAGGKRIRPILAMAAMEALDCDPSPWLPTVCSLECIHTYSLIHDDLPAMDDDDLRRGKPTNHKVYGEAEAILAGDGLLTFTFELLSDPSHGNDLPPARRLAIISLIAKAIGSHGMVGGQSLDMAAEGKSISFDSLRFLHSCKTGALITASLQTGAIIGNASDRQLQALSIYGGSIGLAFQIIDDLLDIEGTTEQLGKPAGSDQKLTKATYPAFLGVEETRIRAKNAVHEALAAIRDFDQKADPLRDLANYIYNRSR